jgi:anti-sigma regulatory factor (Ser/Thr protein kinase)
MNIDRQFPSDSLKDEARVWDQLVAPQLRLPRNVFDICRHGFTKILNNVIDHANSTTVTIRCAQDARSTRIDIEDDGMGVFASLRNHFGFDSDIHALMELTKGKLTVAPLAHSGEGIFFSSKMFDQFVIESGDLSATFDSDQCAVRTTTHRKGTRVQMQIANEAIARHKRSSRGSRIRKISRSVKRVSSCRSPRSTAT